MTLVSIITPTFPGREEELINRCLPSVYNLDWPKIQWIVVSDRNPGPDLLSGLQYKISNDWNWRVAEDSINDYAKIGPQRQLTFVEINELWRNPVSERNVGAWPWFIGTQLALGEFVGFLGDDDEYLPDHVTRHVEAMQEHGATFSISQVEFRAGGIAQFLVGSDGPLFGQHGHLDSDGIMCWIGALKHANWSIVDTPDGMAGDYRLVRDWQQAGLKGVYVGDGPTAIHHDGWVLGKTGRPDRPR